MGEDRSRRDERSREEPAGARASASLRTDRRTAPSEASGSDQIRTRLIDTASGSDQIRTRLIDTASGSDQIRTRLMKIDWTRCDGHGLCRELFPGRIDVDEWGFPVIRDASVPAALEGDARRAVAACPALALRLERAAP